MKLAQRTRCAVLSVTTVLALAGCTVQPGETQTFAGIEFQWCPSGSFAMGSPADEDGRNDDEGQHLVTFNQGFWMAKYEITQAQWQAVMGTPPSYFTGDDLPVEDVSWNDVQTFLNALNASNPGMNFRLPSEAEWEYACRARTDTRFFWGDDPNADEIDNYAWYHEDSNLETHDVGTKQPNVWGLYDMSGNVWEWCQDWYHETYKDAPTDGSAWESPAGKHRILRGGGWSDQPEGCRSSRRDDFIPEGTSPDVGFRIAM